MIYKATRVFSIYKVLKIGELIELDETEAQRYAEMIEPAAQTGSFVDSMPDKKYKKGRNKNA